MAKKAAMKVYHRCLGSITRDQDVSASDAPAADELALEESGVFRHDALVLPALVLNSVYVPVRVTHVREALTMLYAGRANALDAAYESYDFARWLACDPGNAPSIPTVRGAIRAPRVILLAHYRSTPDTRIRLSKRNLLLRDGYRCQYCSDEPGPRDLNIDHIVPRSRNGQSSWENLVVSCRPCNQKKANRTPAESGMKLIKRPARPNWNMLLIKLRAHDVPEWEPYLPTGSD